VNQWSCPLLVPLIEENESDSPAATLILKEYLRPLKTTKPQTLLLACTHYGLIKERIKKLASKKIAVIDQGLLVALKLKQYLQQHPEIDHKLSRQKKRIYYVTDLNPRFKKIAKMFISGSLAITKVSL